MREFLSRQLSSKKITEIVNDKNVKRIKIFSGTLKINLIDTIGDDVVLSMYVPSKALAQKMYTKIKNIVPPDISIELVHYRKNSLKNIIKRQKRLAELNNMCQKSSVNTLNMEPGNGSGRNYGKNLPFKHDMEYEPGPSTNTGNGRIKIRVTKAAYKASTRNVKVKKDDVK